MCFDELFDRKCEVKVCDIIQLFLAGCDDKIYLNLSDTHECNILYLLDDCGFLTLII